jgi:PAS domain S-box-containing protein
MKKDLRILMLEDVPADAELIDSALRHGGFPFQAKRVDTREEFLREIEGRPPDVILSDHGLPSFDGFAALSITREKCPDTPFIFVTGSMGEQVAVNSLRDGATDYVLKTQLTSLAPAVQRALQLSEEKRKRKQAEIERHESEERFYQLVGGMKDCAFFMLDRDGRVSSWNAGTGRITGFQTSEIIGRPFGCCYRPEDREVGRPNLDLKTALAEGRFEEEGWRVRQDGSRFWAHVVITALRDKNGDPNGFSQVIHDVTERRQAQEAMRKSEETHRHLVEQCPEALFVLRNGRIILANAAARELLGADRHEQLIGRRASDFIPAADREVFANRLRSLEETGTAVTVESSPGASFYDRSPLFTEGTLVRWDDSCVAVEIAARRINFQEEPAVQLVAHDLTGRKEQAAAARRETEAWKAAILSASMDAVICFDPESKIIEWNPAAERIFNCNLTEALGQSLDNFIVSSVMRESGLADYLMTGVDRLSGHPTGVVARRANGEEFPAVLVIAQNSHCKPPVFTCVIHDLTARQRAEAALRQSEEQLRLQSTEGERLRQEHLITHALASAPAESEMEKNGSNGSGVGPDPKDLAPLPGDFHRSHPASEPGHNGAKATDNVNLQEEAAKLRKLDEELKDREQSLKEARAALKIREEFIEQSEAILLKKIEAQQERESEIEQKQEELWHLMTRIGLPKDEILEPMALS